MEYQLIFSFHVQHIWELVWDSEKTLVALELGANRSWYPWSYSSSPSPPHTYLGVVTMFSPGSEHLLLASEALWAWFGNYLEVSFFFVLKSFVVCEFLLWPDSLRDWAVLGDHASCWLDSLQSGSLCWLLVQLCLDPDCPIETVLCSYWPASFGNNMPLVELVVWPLAQPAWDRTV